jgi:hypothetical protein
VFHRQHAGEQYSKKSLESVLKQSVKKTGIKKPVTLHWLLPLPPKPIIQAKAKEPFLPTNCQVITFHIIIVRFILTISL